MIHLVIYIRIFCTYKLGIETQTGRYNTMAKTAYFATDANGKTHTRNSDRVYTHTVVYRHIKSEAMAAAHSDHWKSLDANNYEFDVAIATGNHNYTTITADRVAACKARVEAFTMDEYVANSLAERVARVEATDFTVWHNAGWCGRLDLAQKLAAKYNDVAILPAVAR